MFLKDLRLALRTFRDRPGFVLVAVLSLALGIGANSAIFSFADALLLRPLPVADAREVITVRGDAPANSFQGVSYRDYMDLRDRSKSCAGLVAYATTPFGFSPRSGAAAQVVTGFLVSGNFFAVMGVKPELGRAFEREEDRVPGRDAVVVLSHGFHQKQFGGDPAAIGKAIRLSGIDFTIVGVAPKRFTGMDQFIRPALYVPLMMSSRLTGDSQNSLIEKRDNRVLNVYGRLKPGVTLAETQAELKGVAKSLEHAYPATNQNYSVLARTELQSRVDRLPSLAALVVMLLAISGVLLVIACANVAGLLLSRARSRAREMAVRLAIGAGRARLVRQLLTESLVIASAGCVAGFLVAYVGVQFLSRIQLPTDLPMVLAVELDRRVLLCTLLSSLSSAVLFGLAPAIHTTRTDLVAALKDLDAGAGRRERLVGRNALVVGQISLCLMLLAAGFSLFSGFRMMLTAGPGFRTDHLMMMSFDPTLVRYSQKEAEQFYRKLAERVRAIPGAKRVALAHAIPLGMSQDMENVIPEGFQLSAGRESVTLFATTVNTDYFDAMRIPILRGRGFQATDSEAAPLVAVVNAEFARKYWPGEEAVGKRLRLDGRNGPWVQVVGVARTVKYLSITEPATEYLYLPAMQHYRPRMTLLVESTGDPAALTQPLRDAVRSIDGDQPIYDARTMEDFFENRAVRTNTMILEFVACMGVAGLFLAMVGLYGLVSYNVSRQTREIGIRIAMGAKAPDVLKHVLRKGLILAGSGISIGLVGAAGIQKGLEAAFGIRSGNAAPMAGLAIALLVVALAATFIPALRASRIEPTVALRYE